MAERTARRYAAFISYSHRDRLAGDRLFRKLDGYRPPKALIGRDTPFGPVPPKLYPVFRDREELTSSPDLPARIGSALQASEHLVVLCSPHAAASPWVGREVRMFRELGKAGRIHAVIVDGEPDQAFPRALTEDGGEPLAADLRDTGDGWTDGILKLIAGILGVGFGELKNREAARARARARIYGAIAAGFAVLAIVASVAAWRAVEQTRRAEAELSRAEAVILTGVQGIAGIVERVIDGSERGAISVGMADGLLQTAQSLVAGVVAQAPESVPLKWEEARLNWALAEHYRRSGNLQRSLAAADRAERLYDELAKTGSKAAQMSHASALMARGDTLARMGDRDSALRAYEKSHEIGLRLTASDSANLLWQRQLSAGLDRIADARIAAGDRQGALAAIDQSLAIARRILATDPENTQFRADLVASLHRIGDFHMTAGDRQRALEAYDETIAILRRLTASGAYSARWSSSLAASLTRVGDVRLAAHDFEGALSAYTESLLIRRQLAAADPDNADYVDGLAVTLERIGSARLSEGNHVGAVDTIEENLVVRRRIAARDPENPGWARNVSVALNKLSEVRLADGNIAGALETAKESVEISRRLFTRDPTPQAQHDLSVSLERAGNAYLMRFEVPEALEAYEESFTIRQRLATFDIANTLWLHGVCISLFKLGGALEMLQELAKAGSRYSEALLCNARLLALDPGNAQWQGERRLIQQRVSGLPAN